MPSPGCMKESDIFGQTCWVIIVSLDMQGVMQDHVPHVTGTWGQCFHMVRRGNRSWSGRKCIKDLSVCPWAPAFHSTWSPPGCVPKACCNSHGHLLWSWYCSHWGLRDSWSSAEIRYLREHYRLTQRKKRRGKEGHTKQKAAKAWPKNNWDSQMAVSSAVFVWCFINLLAAF